MKAVRGWQSLKGVAAHRIHRWVVWWLYIGAAIGAVALVNILFGNLARTQEALILFLCVLHWFLGGFLCWACEGIQAGKEIQPPKSASSASVRQEREWHPASEFRLPGGGRALLPLYHGRHRRETLAHYGCQHQEQQHHHA